MFDISIRHEATKITKEDQNALLWIQPNTMTACQGLVLLPPFFVPFVASWSFLH